MSMAKSTLAAPTTHDRITNRFVTARTGQPPTEEEKRAMARLHALVIELAVEIEDSVPVGRNKSLALTALEDVQMCVNRAIFDRS